VEKSGRMGDMKIVRKTLVDNPEKKRSLARPGCKWEGNIQADNNKPDINLKLDSCASGSVEDEVFLVLEIVRHTISIPEVCAALFADPDLVEQIRDVKLTATEHGSRKLCTPENFLLLFPV
jgi:hypothetical protein